MELQEVGCSMHLLARRRCEFSKLSIPVLPPELSLSLLSASDLAGDEGYLPSPMLNQKTRIWSVLKYLGPKCPPASDN